MPVSIANLSAWITIDRDIVGDTHAECYAPEYSPDGKTVTCWIVSESGKKFKVHYKDSVRAVSTSARLTLDGVRNNKQCHVWSLYDATRRSNRCIASIAGYRTSSHTILPFEFSYLQLTDDESLSMSLDQSQKIGEIKLVVSGALLTKITSPSTSSRYAMHLPRSGMIYERDKKASVHRVSHGDAVYASQRRQVDCQRLDTLATFIFRYTSLAMLEANEIIPRSYVLARPPTRPPSSVVDLKAVHNNDIIEISDSEREFVPSFPNQSSNKRQTETVAPAVEAGLIEIKSENPTPKRVKHQYSTVTLSDPVVIDLTLD